MNLNHVDPHLLQADIISWEEHIPWAIFFFLLKTLQISNVNVKLLARHVLQDALSMRT